MTILPLVSEDTRLKGLYEELRFRLLDLSRRNQLLNYGLSARSKRFLQIVNGTLDGTHNLLAGDEATLRIAPLPEPDDLPSEERTDEFRSALDRGRATDVEYLTAVEAIEATARDDEIAMEKLERGLRDRVRVELGLPPRPSRKELNRVDYSRSLGIDPSLDLDPASEVKDDLVLQSLKFPDELEVVVEKISADARLAEQEMGLSTLFLAFGFLEWYDSDTSDKGAFAPLLLLPVQIDRQKSRGKPVYSLSVREGGAEANLSLQKLLEVNYGRKLPDFAGNAGNEEDPPSSIEAYIEQVTAAVEGLKRWQVRRWLVLGHFSFGRFAMYSDLEPQKWGDPVAHDLVGSILRGAEGKADPESLPGVPDDYPIDEPEVERIAPFLIQDADASQHSAVVDVMKGSNLVVQGPPGTGKSQTITNIIANALAVGKRVLFLAEKQAALDVVKRRLNRAKLGDFCLELHSDKVSPKTVVASLRSRYEIGVGLSSTSVNQRIDPTWRQSREEISSYVRALHAAAPDGVTPFGLIWKALRGRTEFADLVDALKTVKLSPGFLQDPDKLTVIAGYIEIFADTAATFARNFGHPSGSPWWRVTFSDFPSYDARQFLDALTALRDTSRATIEAIARHVGIGIEEPKDFATLADLHRRLSEVPEISGLVAIAGLDLDDLERALAVRSEWIRSEGELATMRDLRHEDPDRLAIATTHVRTAASTEFLDQSAAEAYGFADDEIAILLDVCDAAEAVLPALETLGLETTAPASQLPAVASAAYILSMAPERYRRWVIELPLTPETLVAEAKDRWRALVDAELFWTRRLSDYRPDARPVPAELDEAAETLRKGGLGKAFASLTGASRKARDLCRRLGVGELSEDLDALATHIRAVEEFEADQNLRAALGGAWVGLSTPVDEVHEGIRLRDFLRKTVLSLPGGAVVAQRAAALAPDRLELLTTFAPSCKRLLSLPQETRARLDDMPLDSLVAEGRRRVATLSDFLTVDPDRLLAGLDAPIRRIAHAHTLAMRIGRLRSTLCGYTTASQAIALGSSEERIAALMKAIAWTRSIRASDLRDTVKSDLLSYRAKETCEVIGAAVREWRFIHEARELALSRLTEFGAQGICDLPPDDLVRLIDDLSTRGHELAEFIPLRRMRRKLDADGLSEFLAACDRHSVEPDRIPVLFEAIVAERRAAVARRAEGLAANNGALLEARRRAFAERDRAKIETDRAVVRAKLLVAVPPIGAQDGPRKTWTEMRLLGNEFSKVKRFTPVRQLLGRAGRAIQTLKPCFMMSPLSLAKFAVAGNLEFDLLVIDEASQMRPEDALGGMLRTRQIVVVGDPKQLPPTDFFARAETSVGTQDDDDDDDDIDAESILEACEKTFRERRRLKWHYRSRCESLIAFSNREFYDGSLITFPIARPGAFSIELVRVDGTYRARRNPTEAAVVAEEAIAFMRHFAEAPEEDLPTLGIVAVNVEQRDFIQEELRRLWTDDELVDLYREKAEAKGEPLFVKNLENVQGDERDHIFISMTYGRKHGEPTLAQYFGPITRKQGHRRLNVLFTRARTRVGLFTSFGSADVRPTETSSDGVKALKAYLEYAETKGRALAHAVGGEPDGDFEVEVADRLRSKGYKVDLQVGVSRKEERGQNFRIDLGVRHPEHPERFLAGIECDGAAYHSSKSARDRDRLREEVLNSLGWELVRVWSTDWFDNPALETEKLVRKLEELRLRPPSAFASYRPLRDLDASTSAAEGDEGLNKDDDATVAQATQEDRTQVGTDAQERLCPVDQEDVPKPEPKAAGAELPSENGSLTPTEAMSALEAFREQVIRPAFPEWDARRSILRPAMIETFVQQRVVDPDEWHNRIPQYLRIGTNAAEKNRFLDEICAIIERIREPASQHPGGGTNGVLVAGPPKRTANTALEAPSAEQVAYAVADPVKVGRPDRELFYDGAYSTTLKGDGRPCDQRGRPDLRGRPGRPYCARARNAAVGQPDQTARHCAASCGPFEDRRGRAHSGLAVHQGCWGYPLLPQGRHRSSGARGRATDGTRCDRRAIHTIAYGRRVCASENG
jgi:Protein of unknown function (DUF4011)/REase_MTES_1575/AAA domain